MHLIHLITSATISLTASSSLAQDISFRADATASVALGRAVLDCLAATLDTLDLLQSSIILILVVLSLVSGL